MTHIAYAVALMRQEELRSDARAHRHHARPDRRLSRALALIPRQPRRRGRSRVSARALVRG
jgi:hypothetical protein